MPRTQQQLAVRDELYRVPRFSRDWALFLDVDGTLLEIAPHPAAVKVSPPLRQLLGRLCGAAGGALALVSGRSVADVESLFAPLGLCVAGQHGAERRDFAGRLHRQVRQPVGLRVAAERLGRFVAERPGLVLENKGLNIAVHYRNAPGYEREVAEQFAATIAELGEDFELQAGKMVYELKPAGQSKGAAIAQFMREEPFKGRVPVFVGDDLTDESGFAVANKLGGHSIKVGAGDSVAAWRLPDPEGVRAWLRGLALEWTRARRAGG
ncbi:MAG TPA: trehalose-phosphatase [Burkholderiales bacterium]|nr:trehalose-phosphatase [Burkholderiales bacterium]